MTAPSRTTTPSPHFTTGMPIPDPPVQTAEVEAEIDLIRAHGVRQAMDALLANRGRGYATYKLARSVEHQLRVAGIRATVPAGCPCGRCDG